MAISVGGPKSEIEAETQKKYIKEEDVNKILDSGPSKKDLIQTKSKLYDLIKFYERIIKSVNATVKQVEKKNQLSERKKEEKYYSEQKKELHQAKKEKAKFRKYFEKIKKMLKEFD